MFDAEFDDLKAIGHGAVTLFYAAIVIAILAVVLSTNSQTTTVLQQFFSFVGWLVSSVVAPVSGGQNVALSSTLQSTAALSGGSGSGLLGQLGQLAGGSSGSSGLGGLGSGSGGVDSGLFDQGSGSAFDGALGAADDSFV